MPNQPCKKRNIPFLARAFICLGLSALAGCATLPSHKNVSAPSSAVILIHGGAGSARPGGMPEEDEAAYRAALAHALQTGYAVLEKGGSALDAVQAAIITMEDNPLFNAGKGAVFTADGKNAMDSSIMDGRTRNAGAVAGVQTVKNPVLAARLVMEKSPHVLLSGKGADDFARQNGLEIVDPSYFYTKRRWHQLERARARMKAKAALPPVTHYGTVGAVALDKAGHLAAATSTGGMTYKRFGRIGDSPIIGAGTYASDSSCAVSATGWGEYFIRATAARDICARVQFGGETIAQAATDVINDISALGGSGGVLALTPDGRYAFSFSSQVMFRGVMSHDGQRVMIYPGEGRRNP